MRVHWFSSHASNTVSSNHARSAGAARCGALDQEKNPPFPVYFVQFVRCRAAGRTTLRYVTRLLFKEVSWCRATPLRVSSRCTVHARREGTRSYAIQQEQKRNKRGKGKTRQEVSASGNGQSSLFTTFLAFSSRPPYAPFFSAFIRLHAKYVYVYISLNIIPSFNKSSCFFFVPYMQIRCTNTKV